ncbi:hypothetical protein CTAYLR_001237 [Chrysophaeum taylorii]|uniref:OTU domain-containing protein n=1 Tax=Chrysophaeum taylorii TaxID=2483200 RepID=A0AAD7UDA5_9STRA|nr:hypothetical protein CTAYLR_001237 [Chrysophaeum taylorii]
MLPRHKAEVSAFRERAKKVRKEARKEGKRRVAEVEAMLEQEEMDLEARHRKELDDLEEDEEEAVVVENDEAQKKEVVERKREKARNKRNRRAARERERVERVAAESTELEKTSERRAELDAINNVLAPAGLRIVEVAADGNCLYRAVEHQLALAGLDSPETTYSSLRRRAADYMRAHEDDFIAFFEGTDPKTVFRDHCARVADTADWGGQTELLALANLLRVPIWVYSRDAPILKMGDTIQKPPLRLAFHRHYFALGEHYNSVAPSTTTTTTTS